MGKEQEVAVRLAAIRAICAILMGHVTHPPAELSELLPALAADPLPAVRAEAIKVLGIMDARVGGAVLRAALEDPEPLVRCRALTALGQVGDAADLPAMRRLLGDGGEFHGCIVGDEAKRATRSLRWRSAREVGAGWLSARYAGVRAVMERRGATPDEAVVGDAEEEMGPNGDG
jgi:hypothetical protein